MFKDLYGRLNTGQKEVVDSIEGPIMVIAGPGTGKTTVITLRIANILQRTDTPPSGILALTFTEAGVRAIKRKLHDLMGDRARQVHVHTFHSFASWILRQYGDHMPEIAQADPITEIDQEALIRDIISGTEFNQLRPAGNSEYYIRPIISSISSCKREAISPDMIISFADAEKKRVEADEDSYATRGENKGKLKADAEKQILKLQRSKIFAEVYRLYDAKKQEKGCLDYDDLLIHVLAAASRDEMLARMIQEQFLYIHVDEHQDTNEAQNYILRLLTQGQTEPNICIVGDEKQAIYRFQGASVENFMKLKQNFPSMKLIALSENYRSHQVLLDAGFNLIEHNYADGEHEDLRIKLKSGTNRTGTAVSVITAPLELDTFTYVIEDLKKKMVEMPQCSFAIIARSNQEVERFYTLCKQAGVQAAASRNLNIVTHPWGVVFLDVIASVIDPLAIERLARSIAAGLWNLSPQEAMEILPVLRAKSASESLVYKNFTDRLETVRKHLDEGGALEVLHKLVIDTGLEHKAIRNPEALAVWRTWYNLAYSLLVLNPEQGARTLFTSLLATEKASRPYMASMSPQELQLPVQIMTAHGSKGLEFDHVYILNATEEVWQGRGRPTLFSLPQQKATDADDTKDARRLFYVALTRAKDSVSLLVPAGDVEGGAYNPVSYIGELGEQHISHVHIESSALPKPSEEKISRVEHMQEVCAHALLQRGLSVTAVNQYLTCPNQFIFLSLMRIPQPPSPVTEKGIVMHAAINRVWQMKERTKESIGATFLKTIEEYEKKSLLTTAERAQVYDLMREYAPKIAQSLFEHFNQKGNVYTETWYEGKPYATTYNNQAVEIGLHGKLDAVIATDKTVSVFDYKTKESMTRNAIMGQTKTNDGGYWRQLVFYTQLIQDQAQYQSMTVNPALVFLVPDKKGVCGIESFEVSQEERNTLMETIKSIVADVFSGDILSKKCKERDCQWCALRDVWNY